MALDHARTERMYGDQTDMIAGFEAGYKAGFEDAKKGE